MTPLPWGAGREAACNSVVFRRCTPCSEADMGLDPLEVITEGCWLAVRFGLHVSPVPTGNLRVVEGLYAFGVGKTYHPLEATLVGTPAASEWQQDVGAVLGAHAGWVSGFLDGFAQEPQSSTAAEYVQGYLAAEELRATRYRRDLPDRRHAGLTGDGSYLPGRSA